MFIKNQWKKIIFSLSRLLSSSSSQIDGMGEKNKANFFFHSMNIKWKSRVIKKTKTKRNKKPNEQYNTNGMVPGIFSATTTKKWQVTAEKKSNVMWKGKEKFNLSPELDN